MITAMSLTNGTLTVIRDNGAEILTARNDHPRWNEIIEAYKSRSEDRLTTLLSLKAVVEEYSVGQLSITATGVLYHGKPVHSLDSNRIMAFLRDGLPYKPLANYMARLGNVTARVKGELYNFLEHKNMPITPSGKIIAYKGVGEDFYSIHGNSQTVVISGTVNGEGKILNEVGAIIEVERSSVDDDYKNHCSVGLHAGSLAYAKEWGPRVVLVEINPTDVVSVPDDCDCQKLRCCKYKVIGEYTGPMPHAYSNEFGSSSDAPTEPDDSVCNDPCDCGQDSCPECGNGVGMHESDAPAPESLPDTNSYGGVELLANNPARDSIAKKLRAIIAEQLFLNESDIKDDSLLINLGMDSLDGVELVMAFEEEFNKEIGDNEAEAIGVKPFSAIVDYIYQQNVSVNAPVGVDSLYARGYQEGLQDRNTYRAARYLAGDQAGADSEGDAQFIDGYLSGFTQ